MEFQLSLTASDPTTGMVVGQYDLTEKDVWSLTLPLHPPIINLAHYKELHGKNLSARDWRHSETSWYSEEHERLTRLRPHAPREVDLLRLLITAVFVKQAEYLGNHRLWKSSNKRFMEEFERFRRAWAPSSFAHPHEFLERIRPSTYWSALENLMRQLEM